MPETVKPFNYMNWLYLGSDKNNLFNSYNNQININVTSLPYNNPNSNYSLSNLNGITSSNSN